MAVVDKILVNACRRYTNLKSRMSLSPAFGSPRANLYVPSPLSRNLSFVSNSSSQSFVSKAATQVSTIHRFYSFPSFPPSGLVMSTHKTSQPS